MKNALHKITGNTYPVKDKLKALGCCWDAAHKCWTASTDEMAEHEALWSDGVSRLIYETNDYYMGSSSWETIDPLLAAEALTLKDL